MSDESSSKASLDSFGYRQQSLASAGIKIDKINWRQLPIELYVEVAALLDFSGTVPAATSLV